jgi:drug/metabolite transporter (DMT)-like permease
MRPVDVILLVTLSAIWGASFMFMRYLAPLLGPLAIGLLNALLPCLVPSPPAALLEPRIALITALFAIFCSAIAYLIYYRLLAEVGPTKALTVTFLIPVFSFIWGSLFLGESIDLFMLGGSLLILCGTYLVVRPKRREIVRILP